MLPIKKQIALKAKKAQDNGKPKATKSVSSGSRKQKGQSRKAKGSAKQPPGSKYQDFSGVMPSPGYVPVTRIEDMNVAQKVHHMLSQKEFEGLVGWMPHGRAFKVLVPPLFEIHICQKYFGHRSYGKFREDLHENGFKYINEGRDEGGKLRYRVTCVLNDEIDI